MDPFNKKEYKLETENKDVYCYGITREEAFHNLKPVYQFEYTPEDLARVYSFTLDKLIEEDLAKVYSENLFIKFLYTAKYPLLK